MSLLNNNFDVISFDPHPAAGASLVTILDVANAPGPYSSLPASGTPVPGDIFPGAIVVMNASGQAVLADNDDALTAFPAMLYVAVDGDQDNDGAFVHRITCIQGGAEYKLDTTNFKSDTYAPNDKLTCGSVGSSEEGLFRKAVSTEQIYGMVGSQGYDAVNDTLHVIIPQGISPALPQKGDSL